MSTGGPWRARLPRDPRARAALGIAAALLAFAAVLVVVDRLAPEPGGARSASDATQPQGLAAYATLLERTGHPVARLRRPVGRHAPSSATTLVVLDPVAVAPREAAAIGAWVRRGGRLVAGGARDAGWLREVLPAPPRWRPAPRDGLVRPLVPVAETAGVAAVAARERGGWSGAGGALPVLGPATAPLLVTARAGAGSVALLADASPLQNRALADADDAALGLALAGPPGRPVAFLETVHGEGAGTGLGALPARVRWALLGLLLAALTAMWSLGRRLGPPEDAERPLPPPRAEHLDALAAALARTGDWQDARR